MKNYIGNNNEINKKKYKKSLPPKLNPDAGNVEYNINMFNRAANVGDAPSSAEGMSGMAEAYDRDNLIARIKEFGKNYRFDKYTDAQLAAMLNRLVDKSNHVVKTKRQDRIDIGNKTMVNDPSYNFDDPDREGDYQVEKLTIRESLNRLDHKDIDEGNQFHDLRSLYEEIAHKLTPQEKQELKNLIQTTGDSDAIKAYIDSKDPNKKNEGLEEDYSSFTDWRDVYDLFISIADKYLPDEDRIETEVKNFYLKYAGNKVFDRAYDQWIKDEEEFDSLESDGDFMTTLDDSDIEYSDVNFDESLKESNDNLTFDELIDLAHKYYKQGGMEIIEFWDEDSLKEYEKEFGPMTKNQAIRLMKVMGNVSNDEKAAGEYFSKQTYDESLNRKEAEVFSRSIFNADSYETVDKILFELSRRDKKLAKTLRDMWDDSASVAYNTDTISSYIINNLDIILHEDTVKQGNKWVNKGKEGTHGKFKTKKAADAQRKAMFANGYKGESLNETIDADGWEKPYSWTALIRKDNFILEPTDPYKDGDNDSWHVSQIMRNYRNKYKHHGNFSSKQAAKDYVDKILNKRLKHKTAAVTWTDETDIDFDDYKESLEEAKKILYVIKDKNGNQLSRPSEDDSELWDRVASMEQRGRKGLKVVVYVPESMNEDYTDVDDEWGAPYTYEETFDNLAELTNNFTDKDGYVRCYYEQEKIYGIKILKKYYKVVEPMDGRMKENEPMSWVISYSNPLNKDKEK